MKRDLSLPSHLQMGYVVFLSSLFYLALVLKGKKGNLLPRNVTINDVKRSDDPVAAKGLWQRLLIPKVSVDPLSCGFNIRVAGYSVPKKWALTSQTDYLYCVLGVFTLRKARIQSRKSR